MSEPKRMKPAELDLEDRDDEEPEAEVEEPEVLEWSEPDADWPHEWVTFAGDRLAVRKPTQQALAAYSLSASQFVSPQMQNDISGLFMVNHISPGSYLRVMGRFMDPDDESYDEAAVGELMKLIVELKTGEMEAENRAARRHLSSAK